MITNSFDEDKTAIITPTKKNTLETCDFCIVTFSFQIEKYVLNTFKSTLKEIGTPSTINTDVKLYTFDYNGRKYGFYRTVMGAPTTVSLLEEVQCFLDTKKFLFFGSCGVLDKEKTSGKIIIPTYAYRDEGTSYHYAKAQDYIEIKNANKISKIFKKIDIPHVLGKCWTTDGFYRETKRNYNKRKGEGCIAVDMECSALQAVCDFRGLEYYTFFLTGDVLDAPSWQKENFDQANHSLTNFDIALKLAEEL